MKAKKSMIIGIPRERKKNEYRVSLTPSAVKALIQNGHNVVVEKSAGDASGISDEDYLEAQAVVKNSAAEIYKEADLIVKVKEPLAEECGLLTEEQTLCSFLHLAPALELTNALLRQKVIGIAYETIQTEDGFLPLLTPMSEIAGKMSIQIGCHYLQKENGGSGVLLGGVPGVKPGNVAIIGVGTVGFNAVKIALGMGADLTILDTNVDRLRYLCNILPGRFTTLISNNSNIESAVVNSDLVIGAVLTVGARTQCVVTGNMIKRMRPGSVIVDVSIDQGGCLETSIPTTLENPAYTIDNVIHCCPSNLPSAVAHTSTFALSNAILPYILKVANFGYKKALMLDNSLSKGCNVFRGRLTSKPVAESLGLEYIALERILA